MSAGATRRCPVCGKPRLPEHTPFCSPRCRDRDLLQWLDEGYRLPGRPAPESLEDDEG
jgi:endogenous inhibitor of DNA gyrase (YacG/DUF329 family)